MMVLNFFCMYWTHPSNIFSTNPCIILYKTLRYFWGVGSHFILADTVIMSIISARISTCS